MVLPKGEEVVTIMRKPYFVMFITLMTISSLSCGPNNYQGPSGNTGGATARAVWPGGPGPGPRAAGRHKAAPAGVLTVRFVVAAADMATPLKLDFPASAGQGTIYGIPPGANRTLTLQGLDANNALSYQGSSAGVAIAKGRTTDCGLIAMAAVAVLKNPDTGQTTKYSAAFGEDADYLINPPSYTDNENGTITDKVTGLIWQKQDAGTLKTWEAAQAYCSGLDLGGYSTGWSLPTRMELLTIVDYGTVNPSINSAFFPGTSSSHYWSSTAYAYSTSSAWLVHFYYGFTSNYSKTNTYSVRCVR